MNANNYKASPENRRPLLSEELRRGKYKKRLRRRLTIFLVPVILLALLYTLFVFSPIPLCVYWRNVLIETAMTTMSHHWIAEAFIPGYIIDDVMGAKAINDGTVGGGGNLLGEGEGTSKKEIGDVLDQANITVGKPDYAGNTVLINDTEQGLIVSEVSGDGYKGKIMLVDDPSRVFIGTTPQKGVSGIRILDYLETYDCIAGVNASGFNDPGGNGSGGDVDGLSCSQGEFWGYYVPGYASMVLTTEDKLVVGDIPDWSKYNIRDGMQFGPVLIADGEVMVSGTGGYGIQPRTAVGQREDGVIALLIIDGRDITYSIGCTVGELAVIMEAYNMVNASCCDGGASSVLAYDGEVITKNCSWNPAYGRMIPNAFLVKRK